MAALIDSSVLIAGERGQLDLELLAKRHGATDLAMAAITSPGQPVSDEYVVGVDVTGQQQQMHVLAVTPAGAMRTLFTVPTVFQTLLMENGNVDSPEPPSI